MPKVEHRRAGKDYPDQGIVKGEMYYYCNMKTGPRSSRVMRSKEPFKRWQLTTSEYFSTLWQIEDRLSSFDGVFSDLEEIIEELETLRDETQGKFDNMPEGLQQGDTGQMLEERVGELEDLISTLQDLDTDEDDRLEQFREDVRNAV